MGLGVQQNLENLFIDEWVDILHEAEWYPAVIKERKEANEENGQDIYYRVKIMKEEGVEKWINLKSKRIVSFRSKWNFRSESATLLTVINRKLSANNQQMQQFGIPLLLAVPNWVTWKELAKMVFK